MESHIGIYVRCPCQLLSLVLYTGYRSPWKLADQLIYYTLVSINYQLYTGYTNFCAAPRWIAIAIAQNVPRWKVVGSSVAVIWNVPRDSHVFAKPHESRFTTCAPRWERPRQDISNTFNIKGMSKSIRSKNIKNKTWITKSEKIMYVIV